MEPVVLRPLRVGEILDVAIKLYRSNFATLIRIVFFVTAPAQVLLLFLNASTRSNLNSSGFETVGPTGQTEIDSKAFFATMVGFLGVTLVTLVTSEIASAASFRAVGAAYLGESQTWNESLRAAVKRLRSIVWITLAKDFVIACGFILCIVPGVYLYAAYAVTTPILMLEGVKGRKALGRSRELVKGRWRPTAGVLLLGTMLTSIVGAAFGSFGAGLLFANDGLAGDISQAIAGTIGSTLTTPILAAVITVLYIDLRVRKEGFDLELLAANVGVDPTGLPRPAFLPEAPVVVGEDDEQPPFWPPPPGWKPRSQE